MGGGIDLIDGRRKRNSTRGGPLIYKAPGLAGDLEGEEVSEDESGARSRCANAQPQPSSSPGKESLMYAIGSSHEKHNLLGRGEN